MIAARHDFSDNQLSLGQRGEEEEDDCTFIHQRKKFSQHPTTGN